MDYINEKKIKGHGNPISFKDLRKLEEKSDNSMCKIEYKGNIGTAFFFRQNISSIKYYNKIFLITNSHVLESNFFKHYNELPINYKNKEKIILLNNRIKIMNEELDYCII